MKLAQTVSALGVIKSKPSKQHCWALASSAHLFNLSMQLVSIKVRKGSVNTELAHAVHMKSGN